MNGIYITQQGKEEIEKELKYLENARCYDYQESNMNFGRKQLLREILSSATVLPVEKSWNHFYNIVDGVDTRSFYPNGVIIKPKE